ncbi:DHHC palmitoyltransferase-domain-containing protein [Hyaloraphidium curvatum]|nr:DHHC palmitoyltransferase-domain-containing protein [Hyaloraphidium curvatum]
MGCCRPPLGFKTWEGFGFVTFVLFLITFIPVTSNVYIFWPWLTYYSVGTYFKLTLPFHVAVFALWVYYWLTMYTGPGTTPKGYDPWRGRVAHSKDDEEAEVSDDDAPDKPLVESATGNGKADRDGTMRRKNKGKKGDGSRRESQGEEIVAMVLELKKSTSEPRYCKTCQCYKPPRSHHCSDCNICVLKMDHHCPWVNVCVGQNNLGHFYRFLVFTSFGVIYNLSLIGMRIYALVSLNNALDRYYRTPWPHTEGAADLAKYATPQAGLSELVFMICNIILCAVLLFTVFILTLFQTYYLGVNTTTIETFEKERMDKLVEKGRLPAERARVPYDLGWYRNFKQVLGSNPWLWFLPQAPEGDGIQFEVNETARRNGTIVEHGGRKHVVVMYPPPEYYDFYGKKKGHGAAPPPPPRYDDPAAPVQLDADVELGSAKAADEGPRHVRRGSEGYVVRTITEEEREKMVVAALEEQETVTGQESAPADAPGVAAAKAKKKKAKSKKKPPLRLDGAESASSTGHLADVELAGNGAAFADDTSEESGRDQPAPADADDEDNADESGEAELWRIAKPQATSKKASRRA